MRSAAPRQLCAGRRPRQSWPFLHLRMQKGLPFQRADRAGIPYLARIRALPPGRPLWQAFRLHRPEDAAPANASSAEAILLDSGRGSGEAFDWAPLAAICRPYFLAGGLGPETVTAALNALHPYGVDVSSGIETDHKKRCSKNGGLRGRREKRRCPTGPSASSPPAPKSGWTG